MSLRSKIVAGASALALACMGQVTPFATPQAFAEPVASAAGPASGYTFPGNDGAAHEVTWDEHSFMVDGERLNIWSGEFHYWRMPSTEHWRDLLQKIKAAGFNAVSYYFFWGLHQSEDGGPYDFSGIKDIELLIQMAKEEGLYVIARPGPYVNAEISMGGLPAYMTKRAATSLRSTDPEVLEDNLEWIRTFDEIAKKYQVTDGGGPIIMYQAENELLNTNNTGQRQYLNALVDQIKADGITVPVFHNDWGINGRFDPHVTNIQPQTKTDFYASDKYPGGFDCSTPSSRGFEETGVSFRNVNKVDPIFITEAQGGSFTPWGAAFNSDNCYAKIDGDWTRQWAVANAGTGVTGFNYYMAFGGTNWGFTGSPSSGFTSYDYGAAIDENRQLTDKFTVQKEIGYAYRAMPQIPAMSTQANPAVKELTGPGVRSYGRRDTTGTDSATGKGSMLLGFRSSNVSGESTETSAFTTSLSLTQAAILGERVDDKDPEITYSGSWSTAQAPAQKWATGYWEDSAHFTTAKGASVSYTFEGAGIRAIMPKANNHGNFEISIDGTKVHTGTTCIASMDYENEVQQIAFEKLDLDPRKPHTITITNLGTQGCTEGNVEPGTNLVIDAFEVIPPTYTVDDSQTDKLTYTGNWTHTSNLNGSYLSTESWSGDKGAAVEYTFTGTGVQVYMPQTNNHGYASFYIDGEKIGESVHSYAVQNADLNWLAFEKTDLTDGEHTLKIEVDGTKPEGSQGAFVSLTAINVLKPGQSQEVEADALSFPRVPQAEGTFLKLHGRDALLLGADYLLGDHKVYYSTTELLAQEPTAAGQYALYSGTAGDDGEMVLGYDAEPTVESKGVTATWDEAKGQLRLNYTVGDDVWAKITTPNGALLVDVITRDTTGGLWAVESALGDGNAQTVVEGAYLVRGVTYADGVAHLVGSTEAAGTATIVLPAGITSATWNGQALTGTTDALGRLVVELAGPAEVTAPTLTWVKAAETPEAAVDFDDSEWTVADDTTAVQFRSNMGPGPNQGVVLDSNHYEFYEGDVWYRATYTSGATPTTKIVIDSNGGTGVPGHGRNPATQLVWVNGTYLGSAKAEGGTKSFNVPAGVIEPNGKVVLSVLVHNHGQNLDWSDDGLSRQTRGIWDASGLGNNGKVTWKIQGASAEDSDRTIYNNGGLYGERAGWHLPGYPTTDWTEATDMHVEKPGTTWYRSTFDLNIPQGQDVAFALKINDKRFMENFTSRAIFNDRTGKTGDQARAIIFVNGWNTGYFVGNVGPQSEFTIPSGFLNPNGQNEIALAVTGEVEGAGPEGAELVVKGNQTGGVTWSQNEADAFTATIDATKGAGFDDAAVGSDVSAAASAEVAALAAGGDYELVAIADGKDLGAVAGTDGTLTFKKPSTDQITIAVRDAVSGQILAQTDLDNEAPAPLIDNLAPQGTVSASGQEVEGQWGPELAIDKNIGGDFAFRDEGTNFRDPSASRWSADKADEVWLAVDLGGVADVDHVNVVWGKQFSPNYVIETSMDGKEWTQVGDNQKATASAEVATDVKSEARYVRVRTLARSSQYSIGIWEFQIFGTMQQAPDPDPDPEPALELPALVPAPVSYAKADGAPFEITETTKIVATGDAAVEAEKLAATLRASTGFDLPVVSEGAAGDITLAISGEGAEEAYTITASEAGMTLTGSTAHGLYNAISTTYQLFGPWAVADFVSNGPWTIPALSIDDEPRFSYRGIMLDPSRSFFTVDEVKQAIDVMAMYKYSYLHMHLTDDQGWRVEITNDGRVEGDTIDYTRLHTIAGDAAMGPTERNSKPGVRGYYTQDDLREITAYAAERHIEIVPEVDMPGHSQGILHAIPQLNTPGSSHDGTIDPATGEKIADPADYITAPPQTTGDVGESYLDPDSETTWVFLNHVVDQVAELTDASFFHIGGDETHKMNSVRPGTAPAFLTKAGDMIRGKNLIPIGWNEWAQATLKAGDTIQLWQGNGSDVKNQITNAGAKVIYSHASRAYFPQKAGYNVWGPTWACGGACNIDRFYNYDPAGSLGLTDNNFWGVEGAMWNEHVRSMQDFFFPSYPRAMAIAEVGWTPQGQRDGKVADFRTRTAATVPAMTVKGADFYAEDGLVNKPLVAATDLETGPTQGVDHVVAHGYMPMTAEADVTASISIDGVDQDLTIVQDRPYQAPNADNNNNRAQNGLWKLILSELPEAGTHEAVVTFTAGGQSVTDTVTITVTDGEATYGNNLDLSADEGLQGANLVATLSDFAPNSTVTVTFGEMELGTVTVDENGSGTLQATVPALQPGTYPVATSPAGVNNPSVDFEILPAYTPQVSLDPQVAKRGWEVTATITGLEPGKDATVEGLGLEPMTVTADGEGNATVTFTVPEAVAFDTYPVTVTQGWWTGSADLQVAAQALANPIDQSTYRLGGVSSQETTGEPAGSGVASAAFDGNPATYWHTGWKGGNDPMPHYITIDLGKNYDVTGLKYLPRQSQNNGLIGDYEIYVTGENPNGIPTGDPVASGTFPNALQVASRGESIVEFEATEGRYVTLVARSSLADNAFAGAAELVVGGLVSETPTEDPEIPFTEDDGTRMFEAEWSGNTFEGLARVGDRPNLSGGKAATWLDNTTDRVGVWVDVEDAGERDIIIDYAAGENDVTAIVTCPGGEPQTVTFPAGPDETWNVQQQVTIRCELPAGPSQIWIGGPGTKGPNIDRIRVAPVDVVPVAPTFGESTYEIPAVDGVEYLVDGEVVPAGTYQAEPGSTVTITARPVDPKIIKDDVMTEWTHEYAPDLVEVTPAAPEFTDSGVVIPDTEGVVYTIDGKVVTPGEHPVEAPATVTVEATPADGYVLDPDAETSWTHEFTVAPTEVSPVAPTQTENGFTIPNTPGVVYKVDGKDVPAGTYPVTAPATVTITAVPADGHVFPEGVTDSWTFTFEKSGEDEPGEDEPGKPDPVTPDPVTPVDPRPVVPGREACHATGTCNFYLVNDWVSTIAHVAFIYGNNKQDDIVVGDWNGDGVDTIGLRRGQTFYLANTNRSGEADVEFTYGRAGDEVLVGDWDGDGKDTLAVRRGNVYYFSNSNTSGYADQRIVFGRAGDEVLVGDWDGDGKDTIAVRRGNAYYINNTLASGWAQTKLFYGKDADVVLSGDWDGDGKDTLAVRRGFQYLVRNTLTSGWADTVLAYGRVTDEVLVGDWNGDGTDTLGVYRR